MPYEIKKIDEGYKVCKECKECKYNEPIKCFSKKPLTKEMAIRQRKAIGMSGKGKNIKMFELFKGTGSIGKVASKMGFEVVSLDFDPIYTPDIETDILKWDYKKWAKDNNFYPDYIWASPPCNTYSPLVYPLRERDPKTAEPFSERAKIGTKILEKTLEIIKYFNKINPKLLYTIENPRGMMRNEPKMKKLPNRETTLYCVYGDFKRKPTDFWSNFNMGLDVETKTCPGKTIPVDKLPNIEMRYSIPSKLVKTILTKAKNIIHNIEKNELKGGQSNPDAELVKGLSGAVFDVAESIPGFGTFLGTISAPIKAGLNAITDAIMYDPEWERKQKNKAEWAEYIREMSLQKYGRELSPEEYRYVQWELKKRRMAKLAKERAEQSERDLKRAKDAGFNTIGEYTANIKIKGRQDLKERLKKAGFVSGREYTQKKKAGEITEEQKKIVEGGAKPKDTTLYNKVKTDIYNKYPKHSLFRSALIQKEYKKRGGKYDDGDKSPLDIKKWFKQKWITLNDYIRGDIVDCGASDTETKYNEYPLCRPLKLAEKLGKQNIKRMIEKKNKLKEKPLITEKLLNTTEYNIKPTITGMGKDKFIKQLEELYLPPEVYLDVARRVAKREGYDPKKLSFSLNNDNKLKYESPEGLKHFGKAGYGDYILWTFKERNNDVPKGYANMKRRVFRKSHGAMSDIHNLGKYSPNELAINILW